MRAGAVGKKFPAIYIAVFPRSSPLETFRRGAGGRLRFSDRISILMTFTQ